MGTLILTSLLEDLATKGRPCWRQEEEDEEEDDEKPERKGDVARQVRLGAVQCGYVLAVMVMESYFPFGENRVEDLV